MPARKCFWCKIVLVALLGAISLILFVISLKVNFQWALTQEHIRFRKGFPSQENWIASPHGTLKSYLFNVTNGEAFLNGSDSKIKLQEIGPIVYRIKGKNEILNQTDSSLTYQKLRYDDIQFDAASSCAPDILNQTIILPNFILFGTAAKFHDWVFLVRHAFNAITVKEPVLIKETINYFLWNFTTPALKSLSSYVPNIVSNCGMLHNALKKKQEIFNVKIGSKNGVNNFFKVNSLNQKTFFPEQMNRLKNLKLTTGSQYCPIELSEAFDNSLFTPYLDPERELTIIAGEACRTHLLNYVDTVHHLGFKGFRYAINDNSVEKSCLDDAMGIKLHKGMFDVSKCLFNDVPSAFSHPHFYGSTYNWSEHFEGLSPNQKDHEAIIVIEPISGIPIEVKYRFQSNIPLPDMAGYSKELQRFSKMVIPTFWYEYNLDDLPPMVLFFMRFNVHVTPIAQPICTVFFFLFTIWCFLYTYVTLKGVKISHLLLNLLNYKNK
ncbi:scavenger receptor class B member 1 [Bactrocera neohumeralis]|uniref:scavenger receptor class B member 1 n=1 Tax=Bactrocera neohumeralis TaxID=98809 RepID=UPI0021661F56|nr:scavenger receptor class B member 1 [Bactrocera neohumeralis]